jgi:crotonobetainyl-CoA:carnitine CoA-transferase CaiB-like acyl-CoA transferase
VIQAASGIMTQVGNAHSDSHRPPTKVGISIADLSAAHIATLATLASLRLGSSARAGGHIDLSMLRGMAWMTQLAWPDGNSHFPPAVTIPCSDGFVVADALAATNYLYSFASASKSREEVSVELRALGIRSAPVLEIYEVLTSTLTTKRNLLQWATYRGQNIPILSSPHRWSATVPPVGPCIGQPGRGTTSIFGCNSK